MRVDKAVTRPISKPTRRRKKKRTRRKSELAERILVIARDCGRRFKEPYRSLDHGELLYDQNGLPK
jgi:antitoxin VapB